MDDFLGAEHDREPSRFLRGRDHGIDGPRLLQGDPVQKPEGADRDLERTGGHVSFADQVHLIPANLLRTQVRGRATEVPREAGDVLDVRDT